jgi:hypothetical protein
MAATRLVVNVPDALLRPVVAYFNPRRVILFGSAARNGVGPDSAYDLLVVLDDDAPPEMLTLSAGYQARRSYHRAADVIPCRESVFKRKSQIAGSLAHAAATQGVVVYERR